MAITTAEAARILVHYIELTLGSERLGGDTRAELQSVVDAFDALDQEKAQAEARVTGGLCGG